MARSSDDDDDYQKNGGGGNNDYDDGWLLLVERCDNDVYGWSDYSFPLRFFMYDRLIGVE